MFIKVRKELKDKRYRIGQRLAIKSASGLFGDLTEERYRFYIEEVEKRAHLPEAYFNSFYRALLDRYAEFVQCLPEDSNDALGSLLINGLLRALNTLHIFVTQFDDATPLERYALFSACLLQRVERVVTRNKVLVVNKAGLTLKIWQPFSDSLFEDTEANFYKLIPLASVYHRMEKPARVALAKEMVGEKAFLSLASDMHLLMEWWQALLEEEEEGLSRLQYAIKRFRRGEDNIVDELSLDIDLLDSPATEHGDAFLEWLINGLADGSIDVNIAGAPVHITEMGIFLETGVFTIFAERYNPGIVDHFAIQRQFEVMINKAGIATEVFAQHGQKSSGFSNPFAKKTGTVHKGVLVFDSNLVSQSSEISNSVKLPHTVKKTNYQSLLAFNQLKKTVTLGNR